MPISIEIKGKIRFKTEDNVEIFIDNSKIKRNFEWREYSPPSFKEDSSEAESQYSVKISQGTILWSVYTSTSMGGISIISTKRIKTPLNIEILDDIYFELKEENNWED